MSEKTLIIKTFLNEAEAEIARGLLRSSGIKSFVSKDDAGGAYPSLQTAGTGVSLRVRPRDAGKAEDILDSIDSRNDYVEDNIRSRTIKAVFSIFAWIFFLASGYSIIIGLFNKNYFIFIGIILLVVGVILEIISRRNKMDSKP